MPTKNCVFVFYGKLTIGLFRFSCMKHKTSKTIVKNRVLDWHNYAFYFFIRIKCMVMKYKLVLVPSGQSTFMLMPVKNVHEH